MNLSKTFYTINTFLVILLSFLFMFTAGLRIESGYQGPMYTSELYSSGSGDNFLIQISVLFYGILLFLRIFKVSFNISKKECFTCLLFFFIQLLCLTLIESGSILETILIDNNLTLVFWLLSVILSPILVVWAYCTKSNKPL